MTDADYMDRALFLAARGRGRTSPNPMVGAVVVSRDGVVVGQGSIERAGEPHAEVHALEMAGDRARGATLYCTLEPCCHHGPDGTVRAAHRRRRHPPRRRGDRGSESARERPGLRVPARARREVEVGVGAPSRRGGSTSRSSR